MHRRWLPALALAVVVLAGVGAWGWFRQSNRPVEKPPAPKPAAEKPVPQDLSLAGKVQARNTVDVAAPIDGILDQYLVNVGEDVFQGEVLARIRNTALDAAQQSARADAESARARVTDLEAQLIAARLELSRARSDRARAQADYERTQKAYSRQQILLDAGATPRLAFERSEKEYQNAKSDYEGFQGTEKTAEDRVETLSKDIENSKVLMETKSKDLDSTEAQIASGEVRSPVNGTVVARRGQSGDEVNPGMKDLLRIAVDITALTATADADPAAAATIRPGQPAIIEIAEVASPIEGTVREVKSGQVFVDFTSPAPVVRPGLTVQLKLKAVSEEQGKSGK